MTELEQKLLDELEKLEQEREAEQELLQSELSTIQQQQQQIIKLLQKPPQSEGLEEKLNKVLQPLFRQLQAEYKDSNEALITELKALLDS